MMKSSRARGSFVIAESRERRGRRAVRLSNTLIRNSIEQSDVGFLSISDLAQAANPDTAPFRDLFRVIFPN